MTKVAFGFAATLLVAWYSSPYSATLFGSGTLVGGQEADCDNSGLTSFNECEDKGGDCTEMFYGCNFAGLPKTKLCVPEGGTSKACGVDPENCKLRNSDAQNPAGCKKKTT